MHGHEQGQIAIYDQYEVRDQQRLEGLRKAPTVCDGERRTTLFHAASLPPLYNPQVALPLDRIGDCLDALTGATNNPRDPLRDGLPIPALVRFIKSEPFYLSPTHVRLALNACR